MRRSIRYSQNLLRPSARLDQLVATSSITQDDTVIDIGAGSGAITRALTDRAGAVVAIESDPRLAAMLRAQFARAPRVSVWQGDFLTYSLPTSPFKVFANIPFNLTSDIVHKLIDAPDPPVDCYLVLQREAADKFAGLPGRWSHFSILHAPWFDMAVTHQFRPRDFTPIPRVDIVLLRCRPKTGSSITDTDRSLYKDFVSYVFNHANPTILPALEKLFTELPVGLGPYLTAKPTVLPPSSWEALFSAFQRSANASQRGIIRAAAEKLRHEGAILPKDHRTHHALRPVSGDNSKQH